MVMERSTVEPDDGIGRLGKLEAIEAIRCVKARYWRALDLRLWDELEACFTPDAVLDASLSNIEPEIGVLPSPSDPRALSSQILRGSGNIREGLTVALRGVRSVHKGFLPEISVHTNHIAGAIFPFEDRLDFPDGGPVRSIRGFGHYHDLFRCTNGVWQIASSTIFRLRVLMDP